MINGGPVIRGTWSTLAALTLAGLVTALPAAAQSTGSSDRSEWFRAWDLQLSDRIFLRVAEREGVGGDFDVMVSDGHTVTLSGTVPTEAAKQRVLRITRRTPGVHEVRDRLRVDPAVAASRQTSPLPDGQLAQRVAQSIAGAIHGAKAGEDWWFSGWRVEGPYLRWTMTVDADAGRVTLDGDVPPRVAREAVQVALKTDGIRSVRTDFDLHRYYGYPYAPYGPYEAPY